MIDYFSQNYSDKRRWMSYWHQIREILSFKPENVLIIGKGDGLIAEYLQLKNIKIITLDIDENIKPDIVASVIKMPFLPELKLSIKLPYPIKHRFKGEHYWEIGKRNYPLKLIKSEMIKSGFSIKKDYIVFENPAHHFFILKK